MMFQTPQQIQGDISLGRFLVWIGIIATGLSSFFYWGMTTSVFDPDYMAKQGLLITISLYGAVLLALVIEAYKMAMLGRFVNRTLWRWFVFASILTSVGGTMIMNQTRQNNITTSSQSYSSAVDAVERAKVERSKYARCASFTQDDIDAVLLNNRTNVPRKPSGKKDWGKFASVKNQAAVDLSCMNSYQNADASLIIANAELTNASGGGVASSGAGKTAATSSGDGNTAATSSNPLMYTVHTLIGVSEQILVMAFYILIQVLVEAGAFHIGGKVETLKRRKTLTANEIQVLNVWETMGIDLSNLQDKVVEKSVTLEMQHQLDSERKELSFDIARQKMLNELELEKKAMSDVNNSVVIDNNRLPATSTSASSGNTSPSVGLGFGLGSLGGIGFGIDLTKNLFGNKNKEGSSPASPTAGNPDITGFSHADLKARYAKYKALGRGHRLCPTCHGSVPNKVGKFYCSSDHAGMFNRQLSALKP